MNTSYQRSLWVIHWIPIPKAFLLRNTFSLWWILFSTSWEKKMDIQRCVTDRHSQKTIFGNTFVWSALLSLYFYMYHCICKGKFWRNMGIPQGEWFHFSSSFGCSSTSSSAFRNWGYIDQKVHWSVRLPSDCDLHHSGHMAPFLHPTLFTMLAPEFPVFLSILKFQF